MMLTDDELAGLISTSYGDRSLEVDVERIERRGRQRRRNARVVMAAAAVVAMVGVASAAMFGVHRYEQINQAAALNRACQASYTAEAGKTLRAAQLPATLGAPLIELERGDARFRLYTSAPGPLRSMIFDCTRTADGSVSGRISYGPTSVPELGQALIAYRDYLPDGTVAMVVQLRDPASVLSVTPAGRDVQVAQRDGMAVVWGPRAALEGATLSAGDGWLDLARDTLALTATFQEEEFERHCARMLDQRPTLRGASPSLTTRLDDRWVLKAYRTATGFALCSWSNEPDDPADGLSYNGPGVSLSSSDAAALGSTLMIIESNDDHTWMAGATPDGTERVEIVATDATVVPAEVGDGVYLARVPGRGGYTKITMTTATTVYTIVKGAVTQKPR